MENDSLLAPSVQQTALTVAAVGELTSLIFKRVAGNDISSGLNGETLTKEMLSTMAMTTFRREFTAA